MLHQVGVMKLFTLVRRIRQILRCGMVVCVVVVVTYILFHTVSFQGREEK